MSPEARAGGRGAAEFLERFRRRCAEQRVPVSGTAEITFRCNLRCVHCFLKEERSRSAAASGEMETAQWLRIIDEIAAAGCLDLLISGGEPLLRQDFAALYRHAATRGIGVTIFTNATLVDEAVLDLLADLPPQAEIELRGSATKQAHP